MLSAERKDVLSESIIDCFKKSLETKFGETVFRVIFANYEIRFGLKKKDVITHSKELEQLLDEMFGTGLASGLIKRAMFEELANRFPIFESRFSEKYENGGGIIPLAINEIMKNADSSFD
jgi:hypothetical protein